MVAVDQPLHSPFWASCSYDTGGGAGGGTGGGGGDGGGDGEGGGGDGDAEGGGGGDGDEGGVAAGGWKMRLKHRSLLSGYPIVSKSGTQSEQPRFPQLLLHA